MMVGLRIFFIAIADLAKIHKQGVSEIPSDSYNDHNNKISAREIKKQEGSGWTPSKNLGNYILCHVRKVTGKDLEDGELPVPSQLIEEEKEINSKRENILSSPLVHPPSEQRQREGPLDNMAKNISFPGPTANLGL